MDRTEMKSLILTVFDDNVHGSQTYRKINELTNESKISYANKHGYDAIFRDYNLDSNRVISWSKTKLAIEQIENYDWVWCTDADLMIMNEEVRLEDIIDNNYDIIVARNFFNKREIEINTGSILIKNSEWSRDFLKRTYDQKQFSKDGWAEQRAMMHLLANDPTVESHFKFVWGKQFNAILDGPAEASYSHGDFVLHLAGKNNAERFEIFNEIKRVGASNWRKVI